jgi:hypothetical protein
VVLPSYNGARKLPVLTPLLALLLAREGLAVLVHGCETENTRISSEKVLSALDIKALSAIESASAGRVLFAPTGLLHPGLKRLLDVRRVVGLRNPAHSLVKLMMPVDGPSGVGEQLHPPRVPAIHVRHASALTRHPRPAAARHRRRARGRCPPHATVLLVDDLVSPAIVALAPPKARVIHVGKRGGCKSTPQAFIEKLMVMAAREGETVVRLKGGDPFIFGRGGEEVEHLRAQGITVQVINGITAGLAGITSLGRAADAPRACPRRAFYHGPCAPGRQRH